MVRDPLFDIIISNRARKSLRRLPQHYARRAILAFEALKQNPAPVPEYEAKKLHGLKDTCRKHGTARKPTIFSRGMNCHSCLKSVRMSFSG